MEVTDNISVAEAEHNASVAVSDAVDVALAQSAGTVENIIDAAVDEIDAANQRAEEIARAAMETEIGRRVATLEREIEKWQGELSSVSQLLQNLMQEISDLKSQTAATATLVVADQLSQTVKSSLIPPNSTEEITEEIQTLQEVIPEALAPAVDVAPAPAPAPAKRRRWL